MKQIPMTVKGAELLRAELEELKNVKRPQITAAIAEARAHGDLKENAEYHAARETTYRIVGDDEADYKQNLISVNSPIARGLIGKEDGDTVQIKTPGGDVEFDIVKVEYI